MTPDPSGAERIVDALRRHGVQTIFTLSGNQVLPLYDALLDAGIRLLSTRHEAAAAFAADVSGQIARRPGVCVSTLGPGAVNMTLGVANAFLDRSPVVAITVRAAGWSLIRSLARNCDGSNLR